MPYLAMPPYERLATKTADLDAHQKSIDFVRFLSSLHLAQGDPVRAAQAFAARWPGAIHADTVRKALVIPGTTTDAAWGGPLAAIRPLADGFLEIVRPLSVIDRLPVRRVPFNTSIGVETAASLSAWVGQGSAKAHSALAFATAIVGINKAATTIVVANELLKLIDPTSTIALRDSLARSVAQFVGTEFLDPTKAPIANVSPGSVTNGVTPIAPTGTTGAALTKDIGALIAQFLTLVPDPSRGVLILPPSVAVMLAAATLSQTLSVSGGVYSGLPVIVSGAAGTTAVAIDADAVLVADDGVLVDVAQHASLQMDSAPDSPTVAASVITSLWQNNLVALRAERYIAWKKARPCVAWLGPCAYVPGT